MGKITKTIWIINQYASHLTSRHEELSKVFAAQGYKVAVITSSFHHGRREYLYDDPIVFNGYCDSVTYVYLHSSPAYKTNGAGRVFNMIDFCRLTNRYCEKIAAVTGKPDFVIASSAPPFVWEVGLKVAKKYKAKYIAEFRDIWPLSLIDVQGVSTNHPLVKFLEIIEKRAYKKSDAIVSTMPYAWKHVIKVVNVPREKIHWMANGINVADVENSLKSDLKLPPALENFLISHWCCVYVGSIVKSECIDFLIRSFSKIQDKDVFFAIIGEGHEKENVQRVVSSLSLSNVKFFSAIDKRLIPKALELAKVCVAAHNDIPIYQYGLSMNKLNDYLISGKPTIFACNAYSIVKEAGHFSIPMGDEKKLADTIITIKHFDDNKLRQLSSSAKALIREKYDYLEIGKRYIQMMENL